MNTKHSLLLFFSFLYLLFTHNILADPATVIKISDASYRELNIAIPPIIGEIETKDQPYRRKFYDLMDYTGTFRVVKEEAYNDIVSPGTSIPMAQRAPYFKPWRAIGVENLLEIKLIFEKSGELRVQAKATDIVSMSNIFHEEYRLISPDNFEKAAKKIIDKLHLFYTQSAGVFSKNLIFIGKKTKKSKAHVFTCDITGANLKQLTFGNASHLSPSWGPKQKSAVFTSFKKGNPDLYSLDLATLKVTNLSSFPGINSGGVYAPSGDFIIYTGSNKKGENLYALDPVSKKRIPLTFKRAIHVDPDFSPNGKYVAYASSEIGNPHVFVAKILRIQTKTGTQLTLTEPKRLTHTGWYNTMPRWSPDSKRIFYASYDRKSFDIYSMDKNGKNQTRLTLDNYNNEAPTLSPSGQMIVYHSNKGGEGKNKKLYRMKVNGSKPKPLNISLYEARDARWSH